MLSRRLKGKWSLRQRQGFHSTLTVSFLLRRHSTSLSNWYNLSLIFTCTNGGESLKGLTKSPFLAINAEGGESISPKQKDRTTTFRKILIDTFQIGMLIFNWYIFKSISIYFQLVSNKTLLKTKRRISFRGSFVLVKGKSFETGGENFKSWKWFSQSYSYTFDYLQKFLKIFSKRICKNKQVVQAWSKMLK